MPLIPHDWNVLVLGYWNPAILTARGIAKELFRVPENTPIAVEIPMDAAGPQRVRYQGLIVSLLGNRLMIDTEVTDFPTLERAMSIACNAMDALPVTPLHAAGFNVRYRTEESPLHLVELTNLALEAHLSDAHYRISDRLIQLSLEAGDGRINLAVKTNGGGACDIQFNFDRQSDNHADLREWLQTPIADVEARVNVLLEAMQLQ